MNRRVTTEAPLPQGTETKQTPLVTSAAAAAIESLARPDGLDARWRYQVDFGQRGVLFFDTVRQRADSAMVHSQARLPALLDFKYETILDARRFPRPVSYDLLRITGVGLVLHFEQRRVGHLPFESPRESFDAAHQVPELNEAVYRAYFSPLMQAVAIRGAPS